MSGQDPPRRDAFSPCVRERTSRTVVEAPGVEAGANRRHVRDYTCSACSNGSREQRKSCRRASWRALDWTLAVHSAGWQRVDARMTTLEEIELALPNGFHDARLCKLGVDYEHCTITMTLDIEVSDPDEYAGPKYRRGELVIRRVAFVSVDAPRATLEPKSLWIDAGAGQPSTSPIELPELPSECFVHWFFVNDWNGFIRVAAHDAELHWAE